MKSWLSRDLIAAALFSVVMTFGYNMLFSASTAQVSSPNPKGSFDVANNSMVAGWTCDRDTTNPIMVHLYQDAPAGYPGAKLLDGVRADKIREQGVADACAGYANRGFEVTTNTIANITCDNRWHRIYAYAINEGAGTNVLLSGSPRSFYCTPPPAPVTPPAQTTPTVEPKGDLAITSIVPSLNIVYGTPFTFTVKAKNVGQKTMHQVRIVVQLPYGASFNRGLTSTNCATPGAYDTQMICTMQDLAPGGETSVIAGFSNTGYCASPTDDTLLFASITSTEQEAATERANNWAAMNFSIPCTGGWINMATAPLDMTSADAYIKVENGTAQPGKKFAYSVNVRNKGPLNAYGINLVATIPAGTTYNAAESNSVCQQSGNTVQCAVGSMQGGYGRVLQLVFTTSPSLQCGPGKTFSNTFTISTTSNDAVQSNNTVNATRQVTCN